ncbi:TPA: fimbrial biogenesis outer membrane usher protein [Salmonella enterica subsp. salamae serovar 28:r:e,n,z15]|nr:fimbrial biogenesis outer membrane usher protein [Salmonella enterica subsp. salamae serovar 28:r:e,n,z15]
MIQTSCRLIMILALTSHFPVFARETFNIHALEVGNTVQESVDLSAFTQANGQSPATYLVTVYINNHLQGEVQNIHFVSDKQGKLRPQITPEMLRDWGIKVDAFTYLQEKNGNGVVDDIEKIIPMSSADFIFNQQRLNLSIPQAAMNNTDADAISSTDWDEGVTAVLLNYNLNGGQGWKREDGNSYYANLRSGINLGALRFRNYSTWKYDDKSGGKWQSISSYLQRDIAFLKSQFVLGDSYTPTDVFDGVPFRGVQLSSDDNMLSDSQRGFAPVIRGIAHSSAEVTVKQSGYTILRTYVAPGAFTLNNLNPTASGGDLTVTIREADGSEQTFVQAYSAVPLMQREGRLKYAITTGKYRNRSDGPVFAQMTAMYGLPHGFTLFSGAQHAEKYHSQALGVGVGLGILGALSADVTMAQARKGKGASYRVLYSKSVQATGTNVSLAGYRYSTNGFYTFADAMDSGGGVYSENRRNRLQLDISQPVGGMGSLYISAWQQSYWHSKGRDLTLSGGWSSSFYGVTYSVFYNQSQSNSATGSKDKQLAMTFQIPLARFLPDSWANVGITSVRKGAIRTQAGLSGTALDERNLSYNIQQSYSRNGGTDGNLSADYKGRYGEFSAGYSNNSNMRQLNYGLQGGVVLHPYGITLSQPLADQFAIVRTPGVAGLKLLNNPGVMTDNRGNAIVPYVSPYRKNNLALNVEELDSDIDVNSSVKTVIPTQGAVVVAKFNIRIGARVLLALTYQKQPIPFGAIVTSSSGNTGIVDDNGLVYLSGIQPAELLKIVWGRAQSCSVALKLPQVDGSAVLHLKEICH